MSSAAERAGRWFAVAGLLFAGPAAAVLVGLTSAVSTDLTITLMVWASLLSFIGIRWWRRGARDEAVTLVLGAPATVILGFLAYFAWSI